MEETNGNVHDPVCGMNITDYPERVSENFEGHTYFFCGVGCRDRFHDDQKRFLGTPLIKLRKVFKSFRMGISETHIIRGIDINIWEGDFVCVIGASGSGKSTTLNIIGLLERPSSGSVFVNGTDITKSGDDERAELRSRLFGFVFQQFNLIPWLTAYENAVLPHLFSGSRVGIEKVRDQFSEVGLGERMHHRPLEMSGGEQQRVAFLRALANDPPIILGDEPTGNLDSATGNHILEMLRELNVKKKKTLVIVTHDADIANKADEIITIKDGLVVPDYRMHKKLYTE